MTNVLKKVFYKHSFRDKVL